MTGRLHASLAGIGLAAVLAAGSAGCLCPPCPGTEAAVGPGAAAATGPAPTGAPAGPVVSGSRLVLWDGDGAGGGAQGWDACDPKSGCSKVGIDPTGGINGSSAIKLHGEGPGWLGMGWNLFGWYPPEAGYDMTPYTNLTFQIRVAAKTPQSGPEAGSVGVFLGASRNKKDSATAMLERYAKGFGDGKWHKVSIPITVFTSGPGAGFDPMSFWEFRLTTWSGTPRNFDIFIDELALEKQ